MNLSNCFKAYDVRGRIPEELNQESSYAIGRAYAEWLSPQRVAVGRDIRLSSAELAEALIRGLTDSGVDVVDIGLCGTEGVYFATFSMGLDGGIMVTASHNPPDYNGMKFVREQSRPISGDTGLQDIRKLAEGGHFTASSRKGAVIAADIAPSYREHLLGYVDRAKLRPLTFVSNPGNGGAGLVIDLIEKDLPFQFIKVHHEPDGTFPHGVPNPMLEENRAVTADAVRRSHAALGIAFDGDFDRCFFFDEQGTFIEGYYIVGLLASVFLKRYPGGRIVHDPRLTWNTLEIVKECGGEAVLCKSGHAFIKQRMREVDAVYGGEMSAHHYFRDFAYCDSGIIPWLVMGQILSEASVPLSGLVGERMRLFPASGEINRKLSDQKGAIQAVRERYVPGALSVDNTDGLSVEFERWRFNLRSSNTEPLVRLNVESRGDATLMQDRAAEILRLLERFA
jgi:phosphomannomutase/phosphomannomutase/phosphoglucomutase